MRGMTLLARRRAIGFQDRVNEGRPRPDRRSLAWAPLALGRLRARQRLAHHPPMHPELLRHRPDRAYPELVLPPNLLEQLHLGSPFHPSLRLSAGCWSSRGGANLTDRKGPNYTIEITALVLALCYGNAAATVAGGDILVVSQRGGTDERGALILVDPATGDRSILSDFGTAAQGPAAAGDAASVAVGRDGEIYVSCLFS